MRGSSFLIRWGSLIFILAAAVLFVVQLVQYSLQRANYPADMTIGGVPVGGLSPQAAAQRLLAVYSTPVELRYGEAVIHLNPAIVGFELNLESMLAAADMQRTGISFWSGFWNYLWNRPMPSNSVPLVASYSEERLRAYLQTEIATRYDRPPTPAQPIPGSAEFLPGAPGQTLDIDSAVVLIGSALTSPTNRTVILTSQKVAPTRPSPQTLEILLKQLIEQSRFTGLVDLYFLDLQTGESIHFAYSAGGKEYPVTPIDIAFTASSTIKIPIMVTVYRVLGNNLSPEVANLVAQMIGSSNNDASDALMKLIDEVRGPLVVSETMQTLGLENTFLGGYFYPGAPLLKIFRTPANQRLDISTNPDIYSQTTPREIGTLL
ncbi:MAG: class A beta-lactamase-related serine hydrolase, partial [Anaerolineales bacterium]|nr:class A beta-lactamase-related serine hydrolase [Anaerolineales bacterium]